MKTDIFTLKLPKIQNRSFKARLYASSVLTSLASPSHMLGTEQGNVPEVLLLPHCIVSCSLSAVIQCAIRCEPMQGLPAQYTANKHIVLVVRFQASNSMW